MIRTTYPRTYIPTKDEWMEYIRCTNRNKPYKGAVKIRSNGFNTRDLEFLTINKFLK